MKINKKFMTFLIPFFLVSCGGSKKPVAKSDFNENEIVFDSFFDIVNESTLNLNDLDDIPEVVNLRNKMTSVKKQGNRGTCTFFTATALVEEAIKRKMGVEVNLSEEYMNFIVKSKYDKVKTEGGYVSDNLKDTVHENEGFLLESDWPYQPSWFWYKEGECYNYLAEDPEAPLFCYTHSTPPIETLRRKIDGNHFQYTEMKINSTNDIIRELARTEEPMSIAIPVNKKGWNNQTGEVIYNEELRKECLKTNNSCSGHAIVLTGYDLKKQVFFFKNSWGTAWGDSGYGTLSFLMVDKFVEHSFSKVKLMHKIDLPQNIIPSYELENFNINTKIDTQNAYKIKINGKIKNATNRVFYFETQFKKTEKNNVPNELNTKEINLSDIEKKMLDIESNNIKLYKMKFFDKSDKDIEFDGNNILQYSSVKNLMDIKSLRDNGEETRIIGQTSIYGFSDELGYTLLKRFYHPLEVDNYSSESSLSSK